MLDREMSEELDRGFPMLAIVGSGPFIAWLQAIVEECCGNLPAIEAYLTAMGITIPSWLQPILDWLVAHYKGARDFEAPKTDEMGATCAQAFANAGTTNAQCAKVAAFMQSGRHPLISKLIENRCLAAYQKAHPGVTSVNWQSIVQWIITNGPQILQFIMALIAAFGV